MSAAPPDRDAILAILRAHRAELEAMGVVGLSLFGSVARGEAGPGSDIDVAVEVDAGRFGTGWTYFGRLDQLRNRLAGTLARHVDIVVEPLRKERLRRELDRDRVRAF